MVNNFWALRREITENNGNASPVQSDTQTHNNHQSENGYLTTPQTMLQRPQNHHLMGINNFNQDAERYHMNNSVDATALSMTDFPFSTNGSTSFITTTRYGQALPLGLRLTSSPQQHRALPLGSSITSSHQQLRAVPLGSGLTSSPQQHTRQQHRALPLGSGLTSIPQQHRALPLGSGLTSSHQQHRALPLGSGLTSNPQQHMRQQHLALPLGSGLRSIPQQHRALSLGSGLTSSHQQHRALPLGSGLTSSPQQHMSSPNTAHISSYRENLAQNFSSNVVGSQGSANWSRNPSRPIFQNQRNSRYLPYGEGSNRRNNSILFNDLNLRPSGNTNRFQCVNDGSIPSATPPSFRPINNNDLSMLLSSGNTNLDSTRDTSTSHRVFDIRDSEAMNRLNPPPFCPINSNDFNPRPSVDTNRFHVNDGSIPITTPPFCPINTEDMSMFLSSGNDNLNSARETSTSHHVFDIRDTDVWRRPTIPPDNSIEAIQTEKKELLLFKDTIPTSSVTETDEANENDVEHLDLKLRL